MDKSKFASDRSVTLRRGGQRLGGYTLATATPYTPRFEFGRVVGRASSAIGRNGLVFFLLAIIISGGASVLTGVGRLEGLGVAQAQGLWTSLAFLVSMIANSILQVSLTRATIQDSAGRRADLRECLFEGIKLVLPVIGLTIVYSVGVGVASILLVVPGVIVAVMWSAAIPVLVEERNGVFASLARSRTLTKGSRWPIFALILLYILALMIVGGLQATIMIASSGFSLIAVLINAVGSAVLALVWSVVAAAIYIELREVKEGVTVDRLAEIFS
jgi:hypothetical protein